MTDTTYTAIESKAQVVMAADDIIIYASNKMVSVNLLLLRLGSRVIQTNQLYYSKIFIL